MSAVDKNVVVERLTAWLPSRLGAVRDLRIVMQGVPGTTGFSKETLFIRAEFETDEGASARDLVVRLDSTLPGLFLKADLQLQYEMISGMGETEVPVPGAVGFEPDASVVGVPFSVVEHVEGKPVPHVPNYNVGGWIANMDVERRGRLWRNGIRALAAVHRVDWRIGFEFLDREEGGAPGLEQLLSWTEEWYEWARGSNRHALIEEALRRLRSTQPADSPVEVLWGDASPGNLLFRDDGSVSAVLDWEAAALGPGEADLGWWLFYDEYMSRGFGHERLAGLPDRTETIDIYQQALGRPVRDIEYYELLAHTRNAIMSMRSVTRQIELGTIPGSTTAITHNPTSKMLAEKLGADPPEVGEDYVAYLSAVVSRKATREPGSTATRPASHS